MSAITIRVAYRVNIVLFCRSIFVLNNGLQLRQLVPHFEDFLKMVIVFDDDNVTLGVVSNVLASIGHIGCIYSSCKPTAKYTDTVKHFQCLCHVNGITAKVVSNHFLYTNLSIVIFSYWRGSHANMDYVIVIYRIKRAITTARKIWMPSFCNYLLF